MPKPQVITWCKIYNIVMLIFYAALAGGGLLLTIRPELLADTNATGPGQGTATSVMEVVIMGVIYAGMGTVFAAAHVVGLFVPRRFWGWVYNLVLISFGLMTCCTWPATIPLIIFWVQEPVRRWYKNEPETADSWGPAQY